MSFRSILGAAILAGALLACGQGSTGHDPAKPAGPDGPAAQGVTVAVEPGATDVQVGGTARFAATVSGTADTTVVWDVVEAGGGAMSATGVYTAPQSTGVFHVRATSQAAPDVSAQATVNVVAAPVVTIAISPRTASLLAGGTQTFTATVTNAANTAVDWAADCGTITAAGVYTAPSTAGTCTVIARSQADATKIDTAVVTVTLPVSVAVSPRTPSVVAGGTVTFTATVSNATNTAVTWSVPTAGCGTITAAGVYTAPTTARTCTVVATSQADATKSDTATVTVTPPVSVAVSPKTGTVVAGGTLTFTATVSNATNTAVTWSVPTAGCGSVTAAGVYTAPTTARTCTVVATSQADATKSDTATVTVTAPPAPVVVTVSPSPASADACTTVTFTASVTGATDRSVTWSVQEGAAGGTITATGVYTAPSNAGTYHVVGTSNADPTKSATSTVTVSDRIVSVAVSPQTVSVPPGGTAQFTATVTTTCGATTTTQTIDSTGKIVGG